MKLLRRIGNWLYPTEERIPLVAWPLCALFVLVWLGLDSILTVAFQSSGF